MRIRTLSIHVAKTSMVTKKYDASLHSLLAILTAKEQTFWLFPQSFVFSAFVVDRLQTLWEDSQTKLSDRTKQLHNMLQDSINWLDTKKRVEPQISRAGEKLESMQEITYTVDDVKKLNNELKVGKEIHVWIS